MDASEEDALTAVCGHASVNRYLWLVSKKHCFAPQKHHKSHGIAKRNEKSYSVAASGATAHVGKGVRLPPDPVIMVTRIKVPASAGRARRKRETKSH